MVTQKEKADDQTARVKGRLVAKGFQEEELPQSILRVLEDVFCGSGKLRIWT